MSRYLVEESAYYISYKAFIKAKRRGRETPFVCIFNHSEVIEKTFVQPSKDMKNFVRKERNDLYHYFCKNNITPYGTKTFTDVLPGGSYTQSEEYVDLQRYYVRVYVSITPLEDARREGNYKGAEGFLADFNESPRREKALKEAHGKRRPQW